MAESAQPPGDESVDPPSEKTAADVDLTELTIKERIALATAQQPAIGLVLVILCLFAFSFLIALALIYPLVAGLFIIGILVAAGLGMGVLVLLRRFDSA